MSTTDSLPDNPGVPMPPPFFLLIAVALAVLLAWLVPLSFLPAPGLTSISSWLGVVVFAAAYAIALAGRRAFLKAGTNVYPRLPALKLVTDGPYRYSRNPMYIGLTLGLVGIALTFSLEWGLILTPLLWVAYDRLVVVREEAYLTRKFGQPYSDYLLRTRRWL